MSTRYVWVLLSTLSLMNCPPVYASGDNSSACGAKVSDQQIDFATEEIIDAYFALDRKKVRFDFLTGLVMPPGYDASEETFKAARTRALTILGPEIEKIRQHMESLEPFERKLWRLAERYDAVQTPVEKAATLLVIIKMFKIQVEHYYIKLIRQGPFSKDLKQELSKALRKIFDNDQTWIAPLESAMAQARITYSD